MDYTHELREILAEYAKSVDELERKKKPFDGIFGFGRRPADDPCHDLMDRRVEELTQRAAGEMPGEDGEIRAADTAETDELAEALFRSARAYHGPVYAGVALVAIQRHGMKLIPRMSGEARRALAEWYGKEYPRRMRFPVQEEICGLLGEKG